MIMLSTPCHRSFPCSLATWKHVGRTYLFRLRNCFFLPGFRRGKSLRHCSRPTHVVPSGFLLYFRERVGRGMSTKDTSKHWCLSWTHAVKRHVTQRLLETTGNSKERDVLAEAIQKRPATQSFFQERCSERGKSLRHSSHCLFRKRLLRRGNSLRGFRFPSPVSAPKLFLRLRDSRRDVQKEASPSDILPDDRLFPKPCFVYFHEMLRTGKSLSDWSIFQCPRLFPLSFQEEVAQKRKFTQRFSSPVTAPKLFLRLRDSRRCY